MSPVRADTWSWSGTSWTHLNPAASPTPRSLHYAAYDGANNELVVFGGTLNGVFLNDTWLYGPLEIPPQSLTPERSGRAIPRL